ncbi:hypothetical protein HT665_01445 [Ursidibacter maritimus]|uniref:Uncharacterized protein n=2 Tax=Ursidibacter maritimus TaxID=1331689 RepID=A0A949T8Y0_9PAST|nr:hypothetical protein [Ursidibacter maritimus]KAE9539229.1 hypothetical protein A1D26_04185 [Ursidibacter maritimus]MBV6524587.1 hypothetical protein [Ursidibacter maritimus]MBV6525438.1 hypothetical protein [Ursidibacter maritimus]MBV6526908.1 hypothetical protein [Ursidibacter maritimus]MBV6530375.1 hypothetical protein [Ursidibacter maritimus]
MLVIQLVKKQLTALLISLFACSAFAENIDQEGRKWVTASDLSTIKSSSPKALDIKKIFKQFIIQDNNINKCLFPEIYQSNDRGSEIIDKWWNDIENEGRLKRSHYLKLKMRLAQKIMPANLAEDYLFNGLSPEWQKQFDQAEKRYAKIVSIKSMDECRIIGKYATDLVEEYDETNQKWRKSFINP